MRSVFSLLSILFLVSWLMLTGCSKSSTQPKEEPPEVPPASTMEMDFSNFNSGPTKVPSAQGLSMDNWTHAALSVGYWKLVSTVFLAMPVNQFAHLVDQKGVKQDDGSWVWSYTASFNGKSVTTRLVGKWTSEETFHWDFYISFQGVYTDFNWFSGETQRDGSSGWWQFAQEPDSANPFIRIDWTFNKKDSTRSIRYTNIQEGDEHYQSYIEFGITNDPDYDAYFKLVDKKDNRTIEIQWNRSTKAGRVKDPVFFGDSNWHCWDAHLQDVACS